MRGEVGRGGGRQGGECRGSAPGEPRVCDSLRLADPGPNAASTQWLRGALTKLTKVKNAACCNKTKLRFESNNFCVLNI